MSELFYVRCPSCNAVLEAFAHRSAKLQCPGCYHVFLWEDCISAWEFARLLVLRNAKHTRKGYSLAECKPSQLLKHAGEELAELCMDQGREEELADLLNCLALYSAKLGWTYSQVEELMRAKLKERFV